MNNKLKNRFYVYIYFDPRKPGKFKYGEYEFEYEPFYVGKGTNNRKNFHIYEATGDKENWTNKRKCEKILSILNSNLKPIIVVYENNIDEIKALKIEDRYVKLIKTIEDGGTLLNLTYISGPVQETRTKLSKITKEFWNSDNGTKKKKRASKRWKKWHKENDINGEKNPNFGNKWNDEQKEHLSKLRKKTGIAKGKNNPNYDNGDKIKGEKNPFYGQKHSKKVIKLLIIKNSKYYYNLISPEGKFYKDIIFIKNFCKQFKLNYQSFFKAASKNKLYKGWKISRRLINP